MEKDSLTKAIREIPFRAIAKDKKLLEYPFILGIYASKLGRVFMSKECDSKFKWVAETIALCQQSHIQTYIKEKEEALAAAKNQSKRSQSSLKLYAWMTQSNESFDPSIAHKILSEVSPSELSSDYLEYTDTSYLHKNIGSTIKTGCIEYSTVVDYCLDTFFNEDTLFETYLIDECHSLYNKHNL